MLLEWDLSRVNVNTRIRIFVIPLQSLHLLKIMNNMRHNVSFIFLLLLFSFHSATSARWFIITDGF